ncbi:hypothetical protein GF338_12415 [candidate division WOR-3 bacterium]|nr:hypothetical protein [candidate division WOR-3 bacterium]
MKRIIITIMLGIIVLGCVQDIRQEPSEPEKGHLDPYGHIYKRVAPDSFVMLDSMAAVAFEKELHERLERTFGWDSTDPVLKFQWDTTLFDTVSSPHKIRPWCIIPVS